MHFLVQRVTADRWPTQSKGNMSYLRNNVCFFLGPLYIVSNLHLRNVQAGPLFSCSLSPACLSVLMCERSTSAVFGRTVFCGAMDSYSLQPCWIALGSNGSTLLPGDIVAIFLLPAPSGTEAVSGRDAWATWCRLPVWFTVPLRLK